MPKIWFKRKTYGWGWTPATWEGWVAVLVYIVIVIGLVLRLDPTETTLPIRTFLLPLGIATVLLLALSWYKGESPRWQWGLPKEEDRK